jgi:hypothetical protein
MNEIIFMVQEPPEGGFAVRDAVICHFEEETRPKIIRLHFVREEVIAV